MEVSRKRSDEEVQASFDNRSVSKAGVNHGRGKEAMGQRAGKMVWRGTSRRPWAGGRRVTGFGAGPGQPTEPNTCAGVEQTSRLGHEAQLVISGGRWVTLRDASRM